MGQTRRHDHRHMQQGLRTNCEHMEHDSIHPKGLHGLPYQTAQDNMGAPS